MPHLDPTAKPIAARPIAIFALLAAFAMAGIRPAAAHAELQASEPPEGAVLAAPPAALRLVFTAPMQVTLLRLLDEAGHERPLRREGQRRAAAADHAAAVQGALPPGAYRMEYRGLSPDGHVGGGAVRFRVTAAAR